MEYAQDKSINKYTDRVDIYLILSCCNVKLSLPHSNEGKSKQFLVLYRVRRQFIHIHIERIITRKIIKSLNNDRMMVLGIL